MKKLGLIYNSAEWRLSLDSSKRGFKAVLLHNTNIYAPIPIAHCTVLNESYDNVKTILNAIGYDFKTRIQRLTTQCHSSHLKKSFKKVELTFT